MFWHPNVSWGAIKLRGDIVMHMNDVLKKCEEKGYKITKQGLYQAGQKYGFLNKPDGQHAWDFDKRSFWSGLKRQQRKFHRVG